MNVHQTFTTAVWMRCAITLMDPTNVFASKGSRVMDTIVMVSMTSVV